MAYKYNKFHKDEGIDDSLFAAGSGDMTKAVYDTNDNGIVDKAASVDDGLGNAATAEELEVAVYQSHAHTNSTNLDSIDQNLGQTSEPTFADVNITGLSGGIITTDNVETSIEELDDSLAKTAMTGFGAWTSGTDATTYTLSAGAFTLDRAGYGYINGKKITWASGQSVTSFSANTFYWLYIDSAGVLQKSSTFPSSTIRLYELLYDGTIYIVAKENHPVNFQTAISGYLHNNAGTTIRSTGAIITRVATGTGAANGDREVKIVGADTLDDHGLSTTIPDSAGAGVTWNVFYRNGSGKWVRDSQVTQLPIKYNNAGTPTALDAINAYAEYVLYVAKDTIEDSAPQYIAVMGEASYTTLAAVLAAISGGTSTFATNELKSIEAAQLGYAVVQYSATGGYIEEVQVAKSSFNQVLVGGSSGSDHGLLTGLGDDDHSQYHNDTRGDARYPKTTSIGLTIDGAGSAISTGSKGYREIPFTGTITGWTILANASGNCVIDVKKSTYSGFPTTASIAGSEKPTLSSQQKNQDLSLSSWTTAVTAGDILEFVVDSATATKVHLFLTITK